MDSFWIIVAMMVVVLLTMMVRLMVMRRSYKNSYPDGNRMPPGKSYFDRTKNCETYTIQLLEKLKGEKEILSKLRIPREGGISQIDLLMVHPTGVYVFEIKDYGGALAGEEDGGFWTLNLPGGRAEKLYNPIWESRANSRTLEEIMADVPANLFYQYIVFGARCEFETVPEPSSNTAVVKRNSLAAMLEKDFAKRIPVLSAGQMGELRQKLKNYAGGPHS